MKLNMTFFILIALALSLLAVDAFAEKIKFRDVEQTTVPNAPAPDKKKTHKTFKKKLLMFQLAIMDASCDELDSLIITLEERQDSIISNNKKLFYLRAEGVASEVFLKNGCIEDEDE
jgi:hypothetical protein